jgi:membrane-associated phospholipid phosphatase
MLLLKILTFPSSAYVIVPVYLIGLFSNKRRFYILSLILFFLSTPLNILLKEFFQIPLNPDLGLTHTYAFPSGHMQNTAILWGSLAVFYTNSWIRIAVGISLILNGIAIHLLGFHTVLDIIGAYYVAIVFLLIFFQVFPKRWINS